MPRLCLTGIEEVTVLETEDLFLGAFGLVRGGELQKVMVRGVNSRRMAVFHISGPDMTKVERDYYRGSTQVNLQLLKSQLKRLKDLAFGVAAQWELKRGFWARVLSAKGIWNNAHG